MEDWLAGRAIDRCRPNSRILKKVLRLTDSEDVAATPELTNIGSYEKCWRIESGSWWLYKSGSILEWLIEAKTWLENLS